MDLFFDAGRNGVFTEIQVNAVNAVNTVSSTYKTMFRFGEEVVCH